LRRSTLGLPAVFILLNSSELSESLGRAAQETIRRYTWDTIAAQMEKVFALTVAERKQE
jgi:glycosyltransferase involved in cell wall biosynthesis